MSEHEGKKLAGYSINWSSESKIDESGDNESLSEYSILRRAVLERYPNFAPLELFMDNFESLFLENGRFKAGCSGEAFEMLQDLEDICWALDIQLASERPR